MTITMADEYEHWATAQIRKAYEICKLKRNPTLVKLITVSNLNTAVMFTNTLKSAKDKVLCEDKVKYYKLLDWGVVKRKEGGEYGIYLDNSKATIRRIIKQRRGR